MGFLHPKQAEAYSYQPTDQTQPPPPYSSTSSLPQQQQQPQRSPSPSVPYGYPPQQGYQPQQQQYPPQQGYAPQQQQYPPQQQPQRTPSPSFPYGASPSVPQMAPTGPVPRTLHIYREGLTQKRGTVYDTDKTTPLYQIRNSWSADWSTSKPHLEITAPGTGQTLATVTFHAWSRTVDFVIHGQPLPMDSAGWFTRSYTFQSPIGTLKWQHTSVWGYSLQCVTERGEWLARFDTAYFSMQKQGRLEIVSRELPPQLVDQLVVTGLAMVEFEKRKANAAGGGC